MQYHFLTQHTENGVVILTFTEPLLNADAVKEAVSVINAGESRAVILDCQAVRSLVGDSLSNLLKLRSKLTDEDGRLVICNVAPDFAEVLSVTRLNRILKIRSNVESAVACMNEPAESTTYSHTQKAPLGLPIYALAVVFLAVGWFVQDVPPIPWLFPPIGVLMLVVAASFHHLTVEDQGDVLSVRFGPVPLFRRNVRYTDIEMVEVGRTTLLDGWGIHMSIRGGWVWNLWGRDCVFVHFRNGGTLRIGTDDAENLAGFLNGKIGQQRQGVS